MSEPIQYGISLMLATETDRPPLPAGWSWRRDLFFAVAVSDDPAIDFFCELRPDVWVLRQRLIADPLKGIASESPRFPADDVLPPGREFVGDDYATFPRSAAAADSAIVARNFGWRFKP